MNIFSTFLFPNNMVVTYTGQGAGEDQVPELQGPYSEDLHLTISALADASTQWQGYQPIPVSETKRKELIDFFLRYRKALLQDYDPALSGRLIIEAEQTEDVVKSSMVRYLTRYYIRKKIGEWLGI